MKKTLKRLAGYFGYEVRHLPQGSERLLLNETLELEPDLLKAFATRAAQLATPPEQTQALRSLHLAGILRNGSAAEYSRIEIGGPHTLQVGLWKRNGKGKNAAFVREKERAHEWFYWADKERIEPKRGKWRVAVVGESVARGFFYDPHFNVSSVLEEMLRSQLGEDAIDVVDLAKSNLTLPELKILAGQSLALRPDIIVIFAGNNWRPHIREADIPYVEDLLRTEGVPAMKSFLDAVTGRAVRNLIGHLNDLVRPRRISIIWVVPEFNLDDWADPALDAPLLPKQRNRQWRDLNDRAARAMREHDFVVAEKLAKDMVALDGATNAVPLRILAECWRSKGDLQKSRRFLEMCRDAEGWDPSFSYSPRTSSVIQDALREAASRHKNAVVDLPALVSRHLDGVLPDRRIFLDYCHLTAEGINLAVAAVASNVLASLTTRNVSPQELQSKASLPPPNIEGKASFLAAVHNAHYFQDYDIVHYWCARALQFWPGCAALMTRFIDCQRRRAPRLACRSAIELFQLDSLGALQYLLRGGAKRLDLVLGAAIVKALEGVGCNIASEISALAAREHSTKSGPKDLTDFYYSSAATLTSERAWTSRSFVNNRGSHSIYASAFAETSKFIFFGERGRPVRLKLTFRVPASTGSGGTVRLEANDRRIAECQARPDWQTLEITVSGGDVAEGINHVTVVWPDDHRSSDAALALAADTLLAGRLPCFYPVFGEIQALLAFDASPSNAEESAVQAADGSTARYQSGPDRELA